tara:strand:+ start:47 stop:259 length:213 start_codon:yes stop_codon:yes gene_type:complete
MNIDFKADCERQLVALDGTRFDRSYRALEKAGFTPQQMFRGVCVMTAKHAVCEYYQKLQDRDHREWLAEG